MKTTAMMLAGGIALSALTALPAYADVTYTWDALSKSDPNSAFSLSFTVSGDVSVSANDGFAGTGAHGEPPIPQQVYPFPAALVSFDANIGGWVDVAIPYSFVSPVNINQYPPPRGGNPPGDPRWSIALSTDIAAQSAELTLFYDGEQVELGSAPFPGSNEIGPGFFTTGQVTTIQTLGDDEMGCSCSFTGELVASDPPAPAPEPSSAWLLLSGVGILGACAVIRMSGARAAARHCPTAAG